MQRFRAVDRLLQQFEIVFIADCLEQAMGDRPEIARIKTVARGLQAIEHLPDNLELQIVLVIREQPTSMRPRIGDGQARVGV